jgi:hypothetical protein
MQIADEITVEDDIVTICGIKYAMALFRDLGRVLPIGEKFSVVDRKDGVLVIHRYGADTHG